MDRRPHRSSTSVSIAVSLAVGLSVLLSGGVGGATPTPYRTNLVVDPSAEQAAHSDGYTVVPIPGWTQTSNFTAVPYGTSGFPTVEEGQRIKGGKLFFAGGPNTSSSSASQRIAIVGRNAAIDRGRVRVTVGAWLAGWDGQTDSAQVVVRFLRSDGSLIATLRTASVSATDNVFFRKTASRVAPAKTRILEVVLLARRGQGTYNDGYFDKIDVRIVPV